MRISPQRAFLLTLAANTRLIRARHLVGRMGRGHREKPPSRAVHDVHVILPERAVIQVDGLWAESFFPCAMTGKAGSVQRRRASILSGDQHLQHADPLLPSREIRDVPKGNRRAALAQSTTGAYRVSMVAEADFGP